MEIHSWCCAWLCKFNPTWCWPRVFTRLQRVLVKFWHSFDLVKWVKFGVSGHFPENAWREWPEILHADVSWPTSELVSLWSRSVDFQILALFWLSETGQIWGFRAFPAECMEGIGLKYCMLMYLDHLQNWLVYGHGLLIFQILALFWLSETGQIWGFREFPGERIKGMAWNFVCWCILTTYRID